MAHIYYTSSPGRGTGLCYHRKMVYIEKGTRPRDRHKLEKGRGVKKWDIGEIVALPEDNPIRLEFVRANKELLAVVPELAANFTLMDLIAAEADLQKSSSPTAAIENDPSLLSTV